jgi:hypothetical protein
MWIPKESQIDYGSIAEMHLTHQYNYLKLRSKEKIDPVDITTRSKLELGYKLKQN